MTQDNKLRNIIVEELKNEIRVENTLRAIVNIAADYRDTPEMATNKKILAIANNIISKYGEWEVIAEGVIENNCDFVEHISIDDEPLSNYFEKPAQEYNGKQIEVGIRIINGK
jgi:hypothetical protein